MKKILFFSLLLLLVSCDPARKCKYNVGDTVYVNMIKIRQYNSPVFEMHKNFSKIQKMIIYAEFNDSLKARVIRRVWDENRQVAAYELVYMMPNKPELIFDREDKNFLFDTVFMLDGSNLW